MNVYYMEFVFHNTLSQFHIDVIMLSLSIYSPCAFLIKIDEDDWNKE